MLMQTGDPGHSGLAVQRHVIMGPEPGQENVTTQLQLLGARTVRDQAMSLNFATRMLVQVQSSMSFIEN